MTDWTDEQIDALCQAATHKPWQLSEPQGSFVWPPHASCHTYGSFSADEQFIAAARELVPALLARARKAEAERDAQRARADHNANAVNENADMIVRLRAELAEANAENDRLIAAIRDIDQHATPSGLADPNDPEGNPARYIVTVGALHRALGAASGRATVGGDHHAAVVRERDEAQAELAAVKKSAGELHLSWLKQSDELRAECDRLAAQVAAVRTLRDKWASANGMSWLSIQARALDRALDGTGQDEAAVSRTEGDEQ